MSDAIHSQSSSEFLVSLMKDNQKTYEDRIVELLKEIDVLKNQNKDQASEIHELKNTIAWYKEQVFLKTFPPKKV